MINIRLPWPPTINTYYTIARGRKILSKRGRSFKSEARICFLEQGVSRSSYDRIECLIDAYPPDKRRRDLDNIVKPILDALTECGIWDDDSQVDILRIRRKQIEKPGYVRVYISEIEGD